jgi:hypothetical protein
MMKMGRTRPVKESRPGPQEGKSGYPSSQNTDNIQLSYLMHVIVINLRVP